MDLLQTYASLQMLGLMNDIIERGSLVLIVFDALCFSDIQKCTAVMVMIGQLHALKSCIRLGVKWRCVLSMINQIGHICLAFIKTIHYGEVKLLL